MMCSKCKVFSIHIPNYDSYICEFGHILCGVCGPEACTRCSVCNGRVIRQGEFLVQGTAKTIFHKTPESYNRSEDSEVKVNMDSDIEEQWSRLFDYRDSRSVSRNCTPEIHHPQTGRITISDNPAAADHGTTSRHHCNDFHQPLYRTPSKEGITTDVGANMAETRELYRKTIYGEASDFDQKMDYYDHVTQTNPILEYCIPPNLEMTAKFSSSKIEFSDDTGLSDSNTVIQHLNEFRKATNYMSPSKVCAYKVDDGATMSEPAIIITSKTKLLHCKSRGVSPRKPLIPLVTKTPSASNTSDKQTVETMRGKVDVGTMMDFCLTPSTNSSEITPKLLVEQQISEEVFPKVAVPILEATPNANQVSKKDIPSLHTLLREKLRNEVYSQFDSAPRKPKNVFMVKEQQVPAVPMALNTTNPTKVSPLTEAINSEVEKAIKNLTTFPNIQFKGGQRRDEIVKQSKGVIRQRILDEVYSNFEKNEKTSGEAQKMTSGEAQSPVHVEEEEVQLNLEKANPQERKPNPGTVNNHNVEQLNLEEDVDNLVTAHNTKSLTCTVGISTESYPKLNPDLNIILPTRDSAYKSHSTYHSQNGGYAVQKIYDRELPTFKHESNCTGSFDREVAKEVFDQFQQNVRMLSTPINSKCGEETEVEFSLNEQVLKFNSSSLEQTPFCLSTSAGLDTNQFSEIIRDELVKNSVEQGQMNSIREDRVAAAVYYIQEPPHYTFPVSVLPPRITGMGDDSTNMNIRNLLDDYREEPRDANGNGVVDINKFVDNIREKFPKITLKQLKAIVLNLPVDDGELGELSELGPWIPPPATFRSDFEKNNLRPDVLQKQKNDSLTIGYNSFDSPTDFSLCTMITAWRASFDPPSDVYSEPTAQFKPVSRFDMEISLIDLPQGPKPAAELNLPRSPIICPLTACRKLIFVSEFSKHLKMDHVKIPVETLTPGKCKNLFLDPRNDDFGINKCHTLYLVTDKIRDLGSKEFKDYLPVLVMATKVSLLQIISPLYHPVSTEDEDPKPEQSYLMVWLTGLSPHDLPIYFSLTAWRRYTTIPQCHIVHSGRIYSIRNGHDEKSIFYSGDAMLLSENQIRAMTNNGQDMIELQVMVH